MMGFQFLRSIRIVLILAFFALAGIGASGVYIWRESARQIDYCKRFGDAWRSQYERDWGPLGVAQFKIAVCIVAILAIGVLVYWLFEMARPGSQRKREAASRRMGSNSERMLEDRRKARRGIGWGLCGIALGVTFVLVDFGLFSEHADEVVLGVFVFLGGYAGVIAGCARWAKAKGWNDAIVFIGLIPVCILVLPFVRSIFVVAPLLLPAGMIVMPLVLIVVLFVLPDKSASSGRRSSRRRS